VGEALRSGEARSGPECLRPFNLNN
jgi:hypothetical protein